MEVDDLMTRKLAIEVRVNGGRNYNGSKITKVLTVSYSNVIVRASISVSLLPCPCCNLSFDKLQDNLESHALNIYGDNLALPCPRDQ